jgi:MFS family permease
VRRDLNISDTQMSLLIGLGFALFYTFFGLPLARVADARSRRGLIASGFGVWSLFSAGCGLARTFTQMLVMRMGVGVGEASLSPAAFSLITDYFPPAQRATAHGVYGMGIYIGAGVASILGGFVIQWASGRPEWVVPLLGSIRSWQLVFFVIGLPGLLFALLMFTVTEPIRRGAQTGAKSVPLSELGAFIWKNRATLSCHNIGLAMMFLSTYSTAAWIPSFFVRHHHWSAAQTGKIYGLLMAVFGSLGIACGGWLADWLGKRGYRDACLRVALLAAVFWIPTGVGYLLMPDPKWAMALVAPTLFILASPMGVGPAALMRMTPARMRGQVSALYLFVGNLIGLGLGPTAVAFFTDYIFHDDNRVGSSLLAVTLSAHVIAIVLLWVGLKPYVRSQNQVEKYTGVQAI